MSGLFIELSVNTRGRVMFYKLLNILDKKISFVTVSAKSSCSNYDPNSMQLAALTLIRNSDLTSKLQSKRFLTSVEQNKYNDLLCLKLESCVKIKRELVQLLKHFNNEISSEPSLNVDLLIKPIVN
jgi:hypothetical protein